MFGKLKLAGKLAVCGAAAGLVLGGGLTAAAALTQAAAQAPSSANFYSQGQFVGLCVALPGSGASDYVELHTSFGSYGSPNEQALGNCAAGHEQLVLQADPALYPFVQPSSSSSSSSSSGDVVTVAGNGTTQTAVIGSPFCLDVTATSSAGRSIIDDWSSNDVPEGFALASVDSGYCTGSSIPAGEWVGQLTGSGTGNEVPAGTATGNLPITVLAADSGLVTGSAAFTISVSG
jgi:hypothetical protein